MTNLYAHRAPTPSSGTSNADLTSATINQRARGYVWRTTEPAGRKPRNPDTGRTYKAHTQPRRRNRLDDIHATWRTA